MQHMGHMAALNNKEKRATLLHTLGGHYLIFKQM